MLRTLTDEIIKELEALIPTMPVMFSTVYIPEQMIGYKILKLNPRAKGPDGRAIQKNLFYTVKIAHKKQTGLDDLKMVYREGGMDMVEEFIERLWEKHHAAEEEKRLKAPKIDPALEAAMLADDEQK